MKKINTKENLLTYLGKFNLSKDKLDLLSIETNLRTPLFKDVHHFKKEDVLNEMKRVTRIYLGISDLKNNKYDYRIKSDSSILRKYEKYFIEPRNFKKVFNDILGFRIICNDYKEILDLDTDIEGFRISDMTNGKKDDDGYRGIHIYYQKNSKCYPIEIQVFTKKDQVVNEYLHELFYKHKVNARTGKLLKKLFDDGKIKPNSDVKEVLDYVLHISKKI